MKKRIIAVVMLAVLGVCSLLGCGSKKAMDVAEVSGRLLKEITYQDDLNSLDIDTAGMVLNLSNVDIKNIAVYESSGWTAEEIVVVECNSADSVSEAKAMLEARVSEQKQCFVDYVPEEMVKLNAAVIVTSGNFAVLSVSDEPEKAKEILDEYE